MRLILVTVVGCCLLARTSIEWAIVYESCGVTTTTMPLLVIRATAEQGTGKGGLAVCCYLAHIGNKVLHYHLSVLRSILHSRCVFARQEGIRYICGQVQRSVVLSLCHRTVE